MSDHFERAADLLVNSLDAEDVTKESRPRTTL
jgi:hypothetical protein